MGNTTRSISCVLVSGAGLLLVGFEFRHTLMMQTLLGRVVAALVPLILALFIVYAGYWLYASSFDAAGVARVTTWVFTGMAVMALTTAWVIGHQFIRGLPFAHAPFVVVNTTTVGGLVGFVTGVYDVRGKAAAYERATLESEQQKLQFVNSVLRHNVLNSMNVILGKADLLKGQLSTAHHEPLRAIETQGRNIVTHVENVWYYTRVVTDEHVEADFTDVNLSRVLASELEAARGAYPDAEIAGEVPEEVYVVGDRLLAVLVENLLSNAVRRDGEEASRVSVSLDADQETARLVVRDDGPGSPASGVGEPASSGGPRGGDTEVGLALAEVLVQRYDGEIEVDESDLGGAVVTIDLPRARAPATASPGNPGSPS